MLPKPNLNPGVLQLSQTNTLKLPISLKLIEFDELLDAKSDLVEKFLGVVLCFSRITGIFSWMGRAGKRKSDFFPVFQNGFFGNFSTLIS